MITIKSLYVDSSCSLIGIFQGDTAQVLIWRSSGQGQGHWSKKRRKSLFLLCKSSIGNNPSSIKHTAMKFARSMGFSDMGDRMVWPPSLSHDRKWPHVAVCSHHPQSEWDRLAVTIFAAKRRDVSRRSGVELSLYSVKDFNQTWHKYSACEWELLKWFPRSVVKGQGHDQTERYNGGGMHFYSAVLELTF